MSITDLQAILLRTHAYYGTDDIELGTVYELFRDENDYNNVHINPHFGMVAIKKEWRMFSIQYVGETNKTFEEIKDEGVQYQKRQALIVAIRIVEARPDYRLFENNCQNFVKSLLQFVCPHASIPATIQSVLKRLQDISYRPSQPVTIRRFLGLTHRLLVHRIHRVRKKLRLLGSQHPERRG